MLPLAAIKWMREAQSSRGKAREGLECVTSCKGALGALCLMMLMATRGNRAPREVMEEEDERCCSEAVSAQMNEAAVLTQSKSFMKGMATGAQLVWPPSSVLPPLFFRANVRRLGYLYMWREGGGGG